MCNFGYIVFVQVCIPGSVTFSRASLVRKKRAPMVGPPTTGAPFSRVFFAHDAFWNILCQPVLTLSYRVVIVILFDCVIWVRHCFRPKCAYRRNVMCSRASHAREKGAPMVGPPTTGAPKTLTFVEYWVT